MSAGLIDKSGSECPYRLVLGARKFAEHRLGKGNRI